MDVRWLRILVELADRGTLRAAATSTGYSTSAVSQQFTALEQAMGQVLAEPTGRRLSLTPAGRALLPHARGVLAALDAARGDLDPAGPAVGPVRVAGYSSALSGQLVPAVARLCRRHPGLTVSMQEREPAEVIELLARDEVDVGLVYDFSLVPREQVGTRFDDVPMALVVRAGETRGPDQLLRDPDTGWITNSRAPDDDELIARVGARFDAIPHVAHRIDSLDLVIRVVAAGLGVALIAGDGPRSDGVEYLDLHGLAGSRRGYAITRPGRERWRANAALIEALLPH